VAWRVARLEANSVVGSCLAGSCRTNSLNIDRLRSTEEPMIGFHGISFYNFEGSADFGDGFGPSMCLSTHVATVVKVGKQVFRAARSKRFMCLVVTAEESGKRHAWLKLRDPSL